MRRILSWMLICAFILGAISVFEPLGVAADASAGLSEDLTPKYGTNGKFLAPIEPPEPGATAISNIYELDNIRNDLSGSYYLTQDIDLSGVDWEPIGNGNDADFFTGIFDGQGHIISNLTITGNHEYAGLFGSVIGMTIKNIGLENTNIDICAGNIYAGGICVSIDDSNADVTSIINNCYNEGNVSATVSFDWFNDPYSSAVAYAGGIFGFASAFSNTSISNCYNTGDVSATASSDGFVGESYYSSAAYAGGVFGGFGDCDNTISISNCYNTGDVSATASSDYYVVAYAGGIFGFSSHGNTISISNCYNTGDVSATASSDGFIGESYYSVVACTGGIGGVFSGDHDDAISISNCYNTGDISATASSDYFGEHTLTAYAGGICGSGASNIDNCCNKGNVFASGTSVIAAGICGSGASNIDNCCNKGCVTAITNNDGVHNMGSAIATGISDSGAISNCCNIGNVVATGFSSAVATGISTAYNIINCYNAGDIFAYSDASYAFAGGINYYINNGVIDNCYNIGNVSAITNSTSSDHYAYAGGVYGGGIYGSGTVSNCYNAGSVSVSAPCGGAGYAGGIGGFRGKSIIISNCYWNIDNDQKVNGFLIADKIGIGQGTDPTTSLTTTQMKLKSSFAGFDFNTVWSFKEGENDGYPVLRAFVECLPYPEISSVTTNGINSISLDLIRPTGNAVLIVAIYEENGGKLLSVSSEKDITESMSVYVDIPIEADTIRAFIWTDLEDANPLCKSEEITKNAVSSEWN